MYREYLKEVYKIYQQIEVSYNKHVKKSKTKKLLYYAIAKELGIPLVDIETAIMCIESNFSDNFKKAEPSIDKRIEEIVIVRADEDREMMNLISMTLKKELCVSTNTLNKYIKVCLFKDAIESSRLLWTESNVVLMSTRAAVKTISIEEELKDVQDKLEEPVGETEADVNEEENTHGEQSASAEEDHLEVLRKELVCELFKGACCECEEEGFFTRTINKIKSFFKGK